MNVIIKKIVSPKVVLKELRLWINWLNDKYVTKYSDQRFFIHSISSQKNFLKEKLKKKNSIIFKIYYKNIFVGIIELGNIDYRNQNCEIMYFIGNRYYWSKGIATKAISLCLDYAKKMRINKVYAGVYANNLSSIKVLVKNKFKIEGKISNFYNFKHKKKKIKISKIILGLNLKK